jgi:hypothetical protein
MRRALIALLAVLPAALPGRLLAADAEPFPPPPPISELMSETIVLDPSATGEDPPSAESPPPATRPPLPVRIWIRLKQEAGRYVADAAGLVTAPAKWDSSDWKKFGGTTLILAGLFAADETIDHRFVKNRSHFTDRVSAATTSFGGGRGPEIAGTLIVGGILFHDPNVRDMGRDALEASLFTGLLNNLVVKRLFGRERPNHSNGETDFDFGSTNSSFPSGHSTEAWSVASVIAMRAPGWIIPGLAYTAATLVSFDRINDRVHFASDVFAGALIGTVVGRWLVARHRREEQKGAPDEKKAIKKVSFDIVPMRNGLGAHVLF